MTVSTVTRRQAVMGSLAAALTTLPAASLFQALPAEASSGLLGLGDPVLLVAALIDAWMKRHEEKREQEMLQHVVAKVSAIAANQSAILGAMANMRVLMRQEIQRAFLEEDVVQLQAHAQTFRQALGSDPKDRPREMDPLFATLPTLVNAIGRKGLPAVPAYLSGISLLNGVLKAVEAGPETFVSHNMVYAEVLATMLVGRGRESLHCVKDGMKRDKDYITLHRKGRRFPLAEVILCTDPSVIKVQVIGVSYEGMDANGNPRLTQYLERGKRYPRDAVPARYDFGWRSWWHGEKAYMYSHANSVYAEDYKEIPALQGGMSPSSPAPFLVLSYDEDRKSVVQTPESLAALEAQKSVVSLYYQELAAKTPDMNAVADPLAELLEQGIEGVGRILHTMNRQLPALTLTNTGSSCEEAPALQADPQAGLPGI